MSPSIDPYLTIKDISGCQTHVIFDSSRRGILNLRAQGPAEPREALSSNQTFINPILDPLPHNSHRIRTLQFHCMEMVPFNHMRDQRSRNEFPKTNSIRTAIPARPDMNKEQRIIKWTRRSHYTNRKITRRFNSAMKVLLFIDTEDIFLRYPSWHDQPNRLNKRPATGNCSERYSRKGKPDHQGS